MKMQDYMIRPLITNNYSIINADGLKKSVNTKNNLKSLLIKSQNHLPGDACWYWSFEPIPPITHTRPLYSTLLLFKFLSLFLSYHHLPRSINWYSLGCRCTKMLLRCTKKTAWHTDQCDFLFLSITCFICILWFFFCHMLCFLVIGTAVSSSPA